MFKDLFGIRRKLFGDEDPRTLEAMQGLALTYSKWKKYDQAESMHVQILEIRRRVLGAEHQDVAASFNSLAWLWATCPKDEFRDGAKAVEYATKACELTGWKESNNVDTLAAAYAEAGDFDSAVNWQQKAIELLSWRLS